MEIPVLNRMTDFEASINSLNKPTLELDFVNFSLPIQFCKWGALFLALAYAFTSFAYKVKILILHFNRKSKSLLATASDPFLSHFSDEFSSSDDENDDVCSSSDDNDDEKEEKSTSSSYDDLTRFNEDFRVKGGFCNFGENQGQNRKFRLRRRRSIAGDNFSLLSDLVSGNGVVKLWESGIPSVSISPAVIFTAGAGEDGKFGLGLWDFRTRLESPAVQAEWRSDRRGKAVGIDTGRTGKVYVSDDVSMGLSVGDVRRLDTPLEYLTEFGGKLTALF